MNKSEFSEFIFLWSDLEEYGVFITRQHFEFLTKFYKAYDDTKTFGEFWSSIGEYGRVYLKIFMQNDDEQFPGFSERMKELKEKLWIFYDGDFPITQCLEETYTYYSHLMPQEYCKDKVRTEYGQYIGLFPISDFVYIKDHMENDNCIVGSLNSPFPINICHYSG